MKHINRKYIISIKVAAENCTIIDIHGSGVDYFYPSALEGTVTCPSLTVPDRGALDLSTTTVGSVASYTCDTGYVLVGPSERVCQSSMTWTGSDPVCNRECMHGNTFDATVGPLGLALIFINGFLLNVLFECIIEIC